jgi:hypothetical protein
MDLDELRAVATEAGVGFARLSEDGLRRKLRFEAQSN